MMTEPKLEVPAELRELAEKTIDQAERAFGLFFDAARRSTWRRLSAPRSASDDGAVMGRVRRRKSSSFRGVRLEGPRRGVAHAIFLRRGSAEY